MKKKHIISIFSFCLIFIILFNLFQGIIHKRWNDLYLRNKEYKNLSSDEVDVLCFGTSELCAAYSPVVTYNEQGITGYNFAVTSHSAITSYYLLSQALEYHTPKVVICDFCALFEDNLPSDSKEIEKLYCEVVDTLDDTKLKFQMIRDLCRIDKNISLLSWFSPLIRYHSLWNELNSEYFTSDDEAAGAWPAYKKGTRLQSSSQWGGIRSVTPDNWNYEEEDTALSELSVEYYDKFIDKCRENGIPVVAVLPPELDMASEYAARLSTKMNYFESRGVYCFNYNSYEQMERMELTHEFDYFDDKHLNTLGSIKFSKALADDLRALFMFPDRRTEENIATNWNEIYNQFTLDMIRSQPTVSLTIKLAEQFNLNAFAEVISSNDTILSPELSRTNEAYGYFETLRPGDFIYNCNNRSLEFFEIDNSGNEQMESSFGLISRQYNPDENNMYIRLNDSELYYASEDYFGSYKDYNYSIRLFIFDENMNIYSKSVWDCDNRSGNPTIVSRDW